MPPIRCVPKTLDMESEGKLRGRWYCRSPVEHSPEAVGDPAYFGDEAARLRLREGDRIEVEPDDMSWMGELIVRAISPLAREVVTRWVVGPIIFDEPPVEAGDLTIKWKGPAQKFVIFNGPQFVEGGFLTKEAAARRLDALRLQAAA